MAKINGLTISDQDEKALKHCLLDYDEWFKVGIVGRIMKSRKKMIREWLPILLADPEVSDVPMDDEDALIDFIASRPDYKDRVEREPKE